MPPPPRDDAFVPGPTHQRSLAMYRAKAARYDGTTHRTDWIRQRTIDALQLQPGQTVLDVGTGSGLSLALLREQVGDSGHVCAFDHSPEMIALARRKAEQGGWRNLSLAQGFAEAVRFERPLDALLFHYTHDILQSDAAIDNLLSMARPGARIAIAGVKFFPWWTGPLNLYAFAKNYAWNGHADGLWRPWRRMATHLDGFERVSTQWGMGYIAQGRLRG